MVAKQSWPVGALVSGLLLSGCASGPAPVVEPPERPALQTETPRAMEDPSPFSAACEDWDPAGLEWRDLASGSPEEAEDDAGVAVSLTRAALPAAEASRYSAGVEICPGFLWILTHSGESRFLSLAEGTWASGPRLAPSGSTGNIGVAGIESGGPVWGFRDVTNAGEWVYLSDAVVDTSAACARMDVHRLAVGDLLRGEGLTSVIYQSTPCLDYSSPERARTPIKMHTGGALAYHPSLDELYLTAGDFHLGASRIGQAVAAGLEATERDYALLLDDQNALSAVVALSSPGTNPQSRVMAKGLRNSLGLVVDSEGTLWATDHGPGGGDELNAITEGGNYGWPLTSEGQPYDRGSWPSDPGQLLAPWLDFYQADVPGAIGPLVSWTPAIAPSNIVFVDPDTTLIPEWGGNLVMGALRGESLVRVEHQPDGSVVAHRLRLGDRIREVIFTSEGSLALLTDSSALITVGR